MIIYNYDENGKYMGESVADESPLEEDVFLIPAFATDKVPPSLKEGFEIVWNGSKWEYIELPKIKPEQPNEYSIWNEELWLWVEDQTLKQSWAKAYFKAVTDAYIQAKVEAWNEANKATGIEFDSITSFPKYAVIPTDSRYAVSVQFLTWNGAIWDAVRAYFLTATAIPADSEFKAVLDGVVF